MLRDRKNSLANSRRPLEIYPEFSKGAVNRAGKKLVEGNGNKGDAKVIENWRAAHSHILNTFQATLRRKAKISGVRPPVQRIKRLKTIENKLLRYNGMQLARMHDIVGCRVIFNDSEELYKFRQSFNRSRFVHKRKVKKDGDGIAVDAYNYIDDPKESGYRGIHDVFEFRAKQSGKENSKGGEKWNGLLIEIQYRTNVQHAWATAVEICDSYTENHGKFSDAPEEYLRYFQIASELLARKHENCKGHLSAEETFDLLVEFVDLEYRYGMLATLRGIRPSQEQFSTEKHSLLIFNGSKVDVRTFSDFREAIAEYFELERSSDSETDVVLVAADDPESVRFGFKNYFSDAREFVRLMEEVLEWATSPDSITL